MARSPERARAIHQAARLRAILDTIEIDMRSPGPPGHDSAQAVTQEATALAMTLARIDVVERIVADAAPPGGEGGKGG
jgi:hypothetical protein